ncbi:hypothetical protein VB636_20940 [Paracoccus sp. APAP_BH8]|uniref:DUF6950 family protein n=1 Tax=Paracoccus sp. APAP_BH8 TaxID=3110237 RepID=UPI002FD831E8
MADRLGAFVEATASRPWDWAADNCTFWVADWALMRWGADFAARYRDRCRSEADAAALTAGGLVALVEPEIALQRKDAPAEGDIGIIEFRGRQVSAIWSGSHWLIRTPRGVAMVRARAIAIWGD